MATAYPYFKLHVTPEVASDLDLLSYINEYCAYEQSEKAGIIGETLIIRIPNPDAAAAVLPFILAHGEPKLLDKPRKILTSALRKQPLLDLKMSHEIEWLEIPGTRILKRLYEAKISTIQQLIRLTEEEVAIKTGLDRDAIKMVRFRLEAYELSFAGP